MKKIKLEKADFFVPNGTNHDNAEEQAYSVLDKISDALPGFLDYIGAFGEVNNLTKKIAILCADAQTNGFKKWTRQNDGKYAALLVLNNGSILPLSTKKSVAVTCRGLFDPQMGRIVNSENIKKYFLELRQMRSRSPHAKEFLYLN